MATQKDVAKLANVSFITVSRVINNMGNVKPETKDKVNKAIKELNYYPNSIAQGLNNNKIKTIAVETSTATETSIEETSYYTRLLAGIEKYCIKTGYDILISTQRGTIEHYDSLKPYYSRKADGIIILGAKPTDEQVNKIIEDNIPCVIIGDRHINDKLTFIDSENYNGMYNATKHLISNGHKKISFITGHIDNKNSIDRFNGFKKAMDEQNYKIEDDWIINGDYTKESGRIAFKYLQSLENKPTAVIASTDLMAFGIYEEVREQNLNIPETISIIGFDGHELCKYLTPPLTTVRQPLEDMGEKAAQYLIKQVEDINTIPQHNIFPVELQEGESVKNLI